MNKRDYGFYENDILKTYKSAITKVKTNFDELKKQPLVEKSVQSSFVSQYGDNPFVGLSSSNDVNNSQGMGAEQRQLSRIRTMDSGTISKPVINDVEDKPNAYGYFDTSSFSGVSYTNSNSGFSFVLVLAAAIALIIMVLVVSYGVISKIGL